MKGLLIKDGLIILRNNRSLLTLMIVCAVMGMSMGNNVPFILCYTATVFGILALGTISYDEYDNGYPFLMSLPFERKTYVREKFVFCALFELLGIVIGLLVCMVFCAVRSIPFEAEEVLLMIVIAFPVLIMILSVLIFVQLKFGVDRSRFVMFIIYGVIVAGAAMVAKFGGNLNISAQLKRISPAAGAAGLLLIGAAFTLFMCRVSIRTVMKKEY